MMTEEFELTAYDPFVSAAVLEAEANVNVALNQLMASPFWGRLFPSIKLTYSSRESKDVQPHPKFDIPMGMSDPAFVTILINCPHCKTEIHPVRARRTATREGVPYPTGLYVTLVCGIERPGCCRSNAGKAAVAALETILKRRVIT